MSVKRHHHHSSSTSSGSVTLPPQKKHVASVFSSPNCDQLKEALQSGGACEFDAKRGKSDEASENVTY